MKPKTVLTAAAVCGAALLAAPPAAHTAHQHHGRKMVAYDYAEVQPAARSQREPGDARRKDVGIRE